MKLNLIKEGHKMQIEIKNVTSKKASKLITKFLEMNANGIYDYLVNDKIYVEYNNTSGFSYIYLENNPHLNLCLNASNELCIAYSCSSVFIEFISFNIPSNIDKLENITNIAYTLESNIIGDDYKDNNKIDAFIDAMEAKGWTLL
jgi:hypothetical protein